jgi:hypothetical protein
MTMQTLLKPLRFEELSRRERIAVTWAFWWRGLLVAVGSGVGGGITGYVLIALWQSIRDAFGIVLAPESIMPVAKVIGGAGGLLVGLLFLWLYMRWLFGTRLAGFRLRLERIVSDVV